MLRSIHINNLARNLIVIILTLFFLSICAFSLVTTRSWINRTFPGFLVMENNFVAVLWLPDWEGFKQGIKFGDVITAVDGKPVSSGSELNELFSSIDPDTPVTYTIKRLGQERHLTIPASVFSQQDYIFIFIFFMLLGLLFYGAGLIVFATKPNLPASRAFLLFSVISGTSLAAAPEHCTNHVNSLMLMTLPLIGPSILILSLYFPIDNQRRRKIIGATFCVTVPLAVLYYTFFHNVTIFQYIDIVHNANLVLTGTLGVFIMVRAFQKSQDTVIRRKVKIVIYGCFTGFMGGIGIMVGSTIFGNISIFWGLPFLALVPLSFGYAIVTGELFDVDFFARKRRSLAFRLFSFLLIISVLVFLPMIVFILMENRKNLEYQMLSSARQTNNLIISTTRYSMLKNDRKAIKMTVKSLKKIPEIDIVRIYSKDGISFSTHKEDIGKKVDEKAKQCIVCHMTDTALENIPEGMALQVFTADDGHKYIAKVDPIYNSRSCAVTDCHPKPSEKKVLGVLETRMRMTDVDNKMAKNRTQLIVFSIVAIFTIEFLTGLFLWFYVHRRVNKFREGTIQVGEGDLDHRVEIAGDDELGQLAESFNDMVEKVKDMVDLEASYRELKKLDEMKDNLLHMVSHDLRTPMTSILGYAYIIHDTSDSIDNDTQKEYLSIMIKEGERLTRLINDLLELQRFEAGRVEMEFEDLDIIELARESIQVFQASVAMQNQELIDNLPDNKIIVHGHYDRLKQVISNYLSNSVKFTPGGGKITVSAEIISESGKPDMVKITVEDTGKGIPKNMQPMIFDKFQQAHKQMRDETEGSGLGLALVNEIVTHHNGKVGLESDLGKGSKFYFILKIKNQGE
jgi:signal transduction histidine kinase